VLGATNRPMDIDSAILRRMPKRFAVGLPDVEQRFNILSLVRFPLRLYSSLNGPAYWLIFVPPQIQMLKGTKLEPAFPLRQLASQTSGFSGSDLRELCRNAAMVPVRECMRVMALDDETVKRVEKEGFDIRPLTINDFYEAEGSTLSFPDPDDEPLLGQSSAAHKEGHEEQTGQPQIDEFQASSSTSVRSDGTRDD